MPIYEYRCADCEKVFELSQSIRQHERTRTVRCPGCNGKNTERKWSRVAVEGGRKGYHPAKPLDV